MVRDLEFMESTYITPETPDKATLRAWEYHYQTHGELRLQRVSTSPRERCVDVFDLSTFQPFLTRTS